MAKLYIKNTDGTFAPHSSIAVTNLDIVQGKGNSLTSAMSQKAVTDELGTIQDAIASIVNAGYVFAGVATPSTDPGTPEAKVFYIANSKGTYTNFGGLEVTEDEVVVLYYDTAWHKEATGIASEEKLTELEEKVSVIEGEIGSLQSHSEIENPLTFTDGFLITTQFIKQATAGWRYSAPVKVTRGSVISVTTIGQGVAVIIKADAEGNMKEVLAQGAATIATYTHEVHEDMFVIICYKYAIDGANYSITNVVDRANAEIAILKDVSGKPVSSWIDGKLITYALLIQPNSPAYRYSAPIKVSKGTEIIVKTGGSGISLVTQCDAEGNLMSSLISSLNGASSNDIVEYRYEVPEDMYVVICYKYALEGSDYFIGGFGAKIENLNSRITELHQPRKLRVLVLGNSYAADAWSYVPMILKNYGIDIEIKMYYRGALALEQLYRRWESTEYQDTEEGYLPGLYTRYLYYCNTGIGKDYWQVQSRQSAKECVAEGDWDIISIQQMSVASLYEESYEPYARYIVDLIRQGMPTPYTLAFSQIFTRSSHDNIEASMTEQGKFWKKEPFNMLLPYGTAVYNARTNEVLSALGNSVKKNLWCSDEVHIQEGLPKYLAALAVVQSIFDRYYTGMSVLGDTLRVTDVMLTQWRMIEQRDNCVGVTEENCLLAQKCAILAVKHPWEILPIL